MAFESIDIRCADCLEVWNELVERSERDARFTCPNCGGEGRRTISAPNVMNHAKPDGYRRGGGYEEMKQIMKVKRKAYDLPASERGDAEKEIAQRRAFAKKATEKKGD